MDELQEERVSETDIADGVLVDDASACEEEVNLIGEGASPEVNKFDAIIGALEDIITDVSFEELLGTFCKAHCDVFESTDENKLIYMEVFDKYHELLEAEIESRLEEMIPEFSMLEFLQFLSDAENLEGDVFDLLLTLSDFGSFKDMMLAYQVEKASGSGARALGLTVRCLPIHTEEQEDGIAMPDLNLDISPCTIRRMAISEHTEQASVSSAT